MFVAVLVTAEKLTARKNGLTFRQVHATLRTTHHILLHGGRRLILLVALHTAAVFFQEGVNQPCKHNQQ